MAVDYGLMAQSDPAYTVQHGANKNTILNLIRQFGSSAALAPQEAAAYGITGADLAGVNDNPYSTVKQLSQQLVKNQYGITNNAAAHGAEFSGAHAAALQGEQNAAGQRNYDATQALTNSTLGVDTTDASQYGSAIQNLMNNYVPPPPPPPTPPAVPVGPTNMQGTPVTFGPAGPGDKSRAPAFLAPPKPPKPPTGPGGMGHIT